MELFILRFIALTPVWVEDLFVFFLIVPGAPPRRVEVEVLNSTALKVMWRSLIPGKQNGQIRGYQVHYVRVENGESRGQPLIKDVMLADAQVWPSFSFPKKSDKCKYSQIAYTTVYAYGLCSKIANVNHAVVAVQILLQSEALYGCSSFLDFIPIAVKFLPPQPTTRSIIKASLILSSLFYLHGLC